jgi:hypothetical protein
MMQSETGGVLADQAVSFRMVVTLKCLSIPLDSQRQPAEPVPAFTLAERPRPTAVPSASPAPPSISLAPNISVVVSAPAMPPPGPSPDFAAPAHGTTDLMPVSNIACPPPGLPWELAAPEFRLEAVVPTVLRALKKPVEEVAPLSSLEPAPAASSAPTVSATAEPPPAGTQALPNLYTAPSGLRKSLLLKVGAGVLAAMAILFPIWRYVARSARNLQPEVQSSIDGGDWVRQAAVGGDPGVKQSRQLVLYKPGLKVTNSRIEFAWSTDSSDVGLVFRAKDLGNYYAVRLKLRNPHTTPTLGVEFFSVYQFVESRHTEKFLELFKIDPVVRVRLDVFGPTFTLFLQDNPTEYWNDARMSSGAIGFLEEWNQSPQVNAVRMSLGERSQLFRKPLGNELAISGGE